MSTGEDKQRKSATESAANDFVLGIVGAAMSKLDTPFIRVQTLLQTQRVMPELQHNPFTGVYNAFARISTEEGYAGFWRGYMGRVSLVFPTAAISFATKDFYRGLLPYKASDNGFFLANIVSGALAGATGLFVAMPFSVGLTRYQCQFGPKSQLEHSGVLHAMRNVFSQDGARGLFRGMSVSVVGVVVYRGMYFGLYDTGKTMLD